jgi:hypothetical protein
MPDESTAPATQPSTTDTQPATAPSDATAPEQPGNWFERLVLRRGSRTLFSDVSKAAEPENSNEQAKDVTGEATVPDAKADAKPDIDAMPDDATVTLTVKELREREQRKAQAEADRRANKAQREAQQAKAAADAEKAKADRTELLKTDPWTAAQHELEAQAKAATDAERVQQLSGALHETVKSYDEAVLDPLLLALPDATRKELLKDAAAGIDGRKALVTDTLKALEKQWRAAGAKDAEQKLRDPNSSFFKRVLAEQRTENTGDEPDLIAAAPSSNGSPPDMDTWIRRTALGRR